MRAREFIQEDPQILDETGVLAWLAEVGGVKSVVGAVKNMFTKGAPELKVAVETGEKAMGSAGIGSKVASYAGDVGKLVAGVATATYVGVTALVNSLVNSLKSIGLTEWVEIAAVVGICVLGYQFAQAMIKKYSNSPTVSQTA